MPNSSDQNAFSNDPTTSVSNMLRRLQENSRINIPALMTQRSSTFSLQAEHTPTPATAQIMVMVYPQNPFSSQPAMRRMNADDSDTELVNSRVQVRDLRGIQAKADEDGNFLYWPGRPEFEQVNVFYYTTLTLRMYERYARRSIPWAFPTPRITISPYIGKEANAFYNEQDRLIGYHAYITDTGEESSTALSADIISHETAHGVLDGLRDLYNESFGLGPAAFHESFGDISAVLVAMHDDTLIKQVLDLTGGNLRISNLISEVAEHLDTTIAEGTSFRTGRTFYLRNAFNNLNFRPFDQLQYNTEHPETELARQPHNYSRLFTGVFYDVLVGIYEQVCQEQKPHIAVYRARDIAAKILVTAIELGPVGEFTFSDMARAFLSAEHILCEGRYAVILRDAFQKRGLLTADEAQNHLEMLGKLPEIWLPETINTAMASALFLEEIAGQLGLATTANLVPLNAYRNAGGHAFLTYFSTQSIKLEGNQYKDYDSSTLDVFGGLTLMFDSKSQLRSMFYRPVYDEDIRQIRIHIAELIEMDMVVDRLYADGTTHPSPEPQGLWVPIPGQLTDTEAKLVKFPVIFDTLPDPPLSLIDYLHAVQEKEQRK